MRKGKDSGSHQRRVSSFVPTPRGKLVSAGSERVVGVNHNSGTPTTQTTSYSPHRTSASGRIRPRRRETGSAAVGPRSRIPALLLALKVCRNPNPDCLKRSTRELALYQQKTYCTGDHVGITIGGLTSDTRILKYRFMESLRSQPIGWMRVNEQCSVLTRLPYIQVNRSPLKHRSSVPTCCTPRLSISSTSAAVHTHF